MSQPWDPDHGLSREELSARLAAALAERTARFGASPEVRWFDEGWDCDVFVVTDKVGSRWLCKLPKRSNVQPWLHKEAHILSAFEDAQHRFVPQLGWTSWEPTGESNSGGTPATGGLPYDWMAISFAPGVPLLPRLAEVDPARLGRSYGHRVGAVHRVSPGGIGERPRSVEFDPCDLARNADSAIVALRRHVAGDVVDRVERMIERVRVRPAEDVAPVFIHGDLFPEHVFFEPDTWDVVGLIDWADSTWGDPAADFCLLSWLLGDAFLDAALDAYGAFGTNPLTEVRAGRDGAGRSEAELFGRTEVDLRELRRRAIVRGAVIGIHDVEVAEKGAPNVPLRQRVEVLERRVREGWLERV
ncbi:MAG: aminoglycoside phosphotransferase family protein [Candidatus Eisenbacteria bacterium]